MTDDKRKATVQINFRADPELKKRFEEAVYDHGHRTGRRKLTLNQVLVELMEEFVHREEEFRGP